MIRRRYLCVLIAITLICAMTGIVAGKPTAQFTASPVKGPAPLTVQFTDLSSSSGTTTYKWDINNDGIIDYTTKNAVHTYTKTGNYSVKHIVKDSSGRDVELKTSYITVTAAPVVPVAPVAAFSSDKQSGYVPLTVQFTDTSTGTAPLTYAWDFDNNGVTDSTLQNPTYTYTDTGTYTANLTDSGEYCP
jgi:PKD repeat protein